MHEWQKRLEPEQSGFENRRRGLHGGRTRHSLAAHPDRPHSDGDRADTPRSPAAPLSPPGPGSCGGAIQGWTRKLNCAEPYLPKQMQRVLAKTRPIRTKSEPAAENAQPPQAAKTPEPPKTPGFVAAASGQAEAS